MLIRSASDIPSSEITDPSIYLRRREFLKGAARGATALAAGPFLSACFAAEQAEAGSPLEGVVRGAAKFQTDETQTKVHDATGYNNFYEFGTDKSDPARYADTLRTEPWSVVIDGECAKPGKIGLEELIAPHQLEERVYRFRCVEAWSMVIPWIGIPLASVLSRVEPSSGAKFVAFETLHDPEQMPGQERRVLDWPYREGLRIDEAMNPLALLVVGMYGEAIPNQNGAPLRLMLPWKYGFKAIKSIVRIRLTKEMPYTSWSDSAPSEYGFYANVNPAVDHPRWSQKRERRIGEFRKRETLPFNGYADQVASLYSGMDLRKNF